MKVAVWRKGEWKPSKYSDGDNLRVTFKGLDDNKSYYLNLDNSQQFVVDKWLPYIKEGQVLDVTLSSPNSNLINKFGYFTLKKKIGGDDE